MIAVFFGLAFLAAVSLRALLLLAGGRSPHRCHHDP